MDRPIAAFDIETIPDPDAGRRLLGLEGSDAEVVAAMVERRKEATDGRDAYPEPPFHRIVTVGVAWLEPATGRFKLGTVGGDAMDERSHVEGFFELVRRPRTAPRLVSWNGGGFDLPILRYRALVHGIAAPDFYRVDGEWRWNNYHNRYHDMHVDLMDVLAGYGASRWVGLGAMGQAVGLPGKAFVEEPVWIHVLNGEEELVREYCKHDVLETLLLHLIHSFHCGRLAPEDLRDHLDTIRDALRDEPCEGWREVLDALDGWPTWLHPSPPRQAAANR